MGPLTPPDEPVGLPAQTNIQMELVEGSGTPSEQDMPAIPLHIHRRVNEDAVSISLVLGLQSSSMSVRRLFCD